MTLDRSSDGIMARLAFWVPLALNGAVGTFPVGSCSRPVPDAAFTAAFVGLGVVSLGLILRAVWAHRGFHALAGFLLLLSAVLFPLAHLAQFGSHLLGRG